MLRINGQFTAAVVFTDQIEDTARENIKAMCDLEFLRESKIRIMPDVHAGKGCTIGTTMTIQDKIVPNFVGVDIGCGIEVVELNTEDIFFKKLDAFIREHIPSGQGVRHKIHHFNQQIDLTKLKCIDHISLDRAKRSIGTLGGGNHFIEVAKDDQGHYYLIVHSGSRHLGHQVADYYQNEAYKQLLNKHQKDRDEEILLLKSTAPKYEIEKRIKELKKLSKAAVSKDFAYVEGKLFDDYLHDMKITQDFADLNRKAMVETIVTGMEWNIKESFTTIHNYVDLDAMILRKGAVRAEENEKFIIPINMRDGSLICLGKGNPDWNQSAPHGAGRLLSRANAKKKITMDDYIQSMEGIFTTSVNTSTLDEAPQAYKSMQDIVRNITPTADILTRIVPVYNFKAKE